MPIPRDIRPCLTLVLAAVSLPTSTVLAEHALVAAANAAGPVTSPPCALEEEVIETDQLRVRGVRTHFDACPVDLATDYDAHARAFATFPQIQASALAFLVEGWGEAGAHRTVANASAATFDDVTIDADDLNGSPGSVTLEVEVRGILDASTTNTPSQAIVVAAYTMELRLGGAPPVISIARTTDEFEGAIEEAFDHPPAEIVFGEPFRVELHAGVSAEVVRPSIGNPFQLITGEAEVELFSVEVIDFHVRDADGVVLDGTDYTVISSSGEFDPPSTPVRDVSWSILKSRYR